MADREQLVAACWQELCERDDRTSPEEYPDMCLITRDELAEFMSRALAKPASEPAGGGVTAEAIARWKRDSELLSAIQDECWDVRFTSSPNADAGDYNVNIEIVGHFMAEPQERVVGENYNEDLRAALEQAMTAEPYPPARPVYDEPSALSSPASSPAEAEALPDGVEAAEIKRIHDWLLDRNREHLYATGVMIRRHPGDAEMFLDAAILLSKLAASPAPADETIYQIEHDGFRGTRQGSYVTREGKRGVVLQQVGTRVVHVYGEKWLQPGATQES